MTQDEFIKKAKKLYNNEYDYSKVNYINAKTPVIIICHKKDKFGIEHGEFLVEPSAFLHKKGGCKRCNGIYSYNFDEFIKISQIVHGNKYDYSLVDYNGVLEKVCIICPEHGEFWQSPKSHIHGSGCIKCSRQNRKKIIIKSNDDFIKKAKEIHGDKYDYSKVNYINASTKVCIICPEHGEFWQLPHTHFKRGCNLCSKPIHDTQSFIKKAKEIHGDKYDYSKVNYINSKEKVCIICPEHGEFWQIPNNHLRKRCCPKCSIYTMRQEQSLSTEEFIKRSKEIHGDKYDYSKVNYINSKEKVCIICPEHGEFLQAPQKHLAGHKCQKCKMSSLERDVYNMLIKNNIDFIYQANKNNIHWIGKQSLDFYIPILNIGIECQGEQHYIPVKFGSKHITDADALERLKMCKYNDKIKMDKCIKNNCNLIYYCNNKYAALNDFSEISKLENFLNNIIKHKIDE